MRSKEVGFLLYPFFLIAFLLFVSNIFIVETKQKVMHHLKLEISDSIFDEATCSCDTILNKLNYLVRNGVGSDEAIIDIQILNYTTKEELPKTSDINSIAIVSNTIYNGIYTISSEIPKNPTTGSLWIVSNQHFSAYLNSNRANIPISHVMQYVGNRWLEVEAYLYDGSWKSLSGKVKITLTAENSNISGGTTLQNLVTNGSFENGAIGWYGMRDQNGVSSPNTVNSEDATPIRSNIHAHGSHSMHILDTVTNQNRYLFQQFNIAIGNKVYLRLKAKGSGSLDISLMTYQNSAELWELPISKRYVDQKSGMTLYSALGNTKSLTKQFLQIGVCAACTGDHYIDEAMVIDTSKHYGSGKEPNQATLDEILFFEHKAGVKQSEVLAGNSIFFDITAENGYNLEQKVVCENGSIGILDGGKLTFQRVYQNDRCKVTAYPKQISNVVAAKIMNGKKVYDSYGNLITGTLMGQKTTAQANHVISGIKGYQNNGNLITGTLVSKNNGTKTTDLVKNDSAQNFKIYIDPGAYLQMASNHSNRAQVLIPYDQLITTFGITADKIKKGETVAGVTGTYSITPSNAGVHVTEVGSNYCGDDWLLRSDIAIGTYVVINAMYFSPGIVSGSVMSVYQGTVTSDRGQTEGPSQVSLISESKSSYMLVQTYRVVVNKKLASGTRVGRMSNCASGKYGNIYGKSTWVKIS